MKAYNIENTPNQIIITDDYGNQFFQSYGKMIAKISHDGNVSLDLKYWDYSRTTGKYRNRFLSEDKNTTQKRIDAGIYALENLNA